ncbi:unnamed protein product [Sphenostylis stenocarpa]|uniref:J domain-containing protein n=1 Tax=Sphenostylis stenocarpa TaxID=92480 RepID=A0AA86VUH3_9FABA|nr:unnamed protein product [Sphenostylis stenocarpa]
MTDIPFSFSTFDRRIKLSQFSSSHCIQSQISPLTSTTLSFPLYPSLQNIPMSLTLNLTPLTAVTTTLRSPPRVAMIRAFTATIDSRRPASLYEVLRIKQNASAVEIKSAYRNLAKVYHPDSALRRSESDQRDFIEIHDAYETLSDPSARAVYDLSLMSARGGGGSFSSLVAPNSSSGLYHQTRKWETDQCW